MTQDPMDSPVLGPRFEEALIYAVRLHQSQRRKGSQVPYSAHLLGVAALVLEDGGDEDEAIAALLHDAVEDQGGQETLAEIRQRFGKRVARIVEGCTDSDTIPKPPWRERKERYVDHARTLGPDALRVSAADKVYNVRTIIFGYRLQGEEFWRIFRGGRDGILWYYRALVQAYREAGGSELVDLLDRLVSELEELVTPGGSRSRPGR